jgi:hypothetical protein
MPEEYQPGRRTRILISNGIFQVVASEKRRYFDIFDGNDEKFGDSFLRDHHSRRPDHQPVSKKPILLKR